MLELMQPRRKKRNPATALLVLGVIGFTWWHHESKTIAVSPRAAKETALKTAESAARPAAPVAVLAPMTKMAPIMPLAIADRFLALTVIEQCEEPPANRPRVRWTLTKLVRDERAKEPLIRVEESWQQGSKGPLLTKQSAMVADHVMVKLKPGQRIEPLLKRFKSLNPDIRRRMPASNLWVIGFEEPGLDTVPLAVSAMRRAGDLVDRVMPDYLPLPSAPVNERNMGEHRVPSASPVSKSSVQGTEVAVGSGF